MGTPNSGINGTLANGLIGHWDFDNGSLLDRSGNDRNLTKVGTVDSVSDKDGITSGAVSFAGTSNSSVNKIQLGLATNYPYESNDIIDEIRIGDRVLTGQVDTVGEIATGEIAELYTMGDNYNR